MPTRLREDHETLRSSLRRFLQDELTPALVRQIDDDDQVPEFLVARMVELGYLGATYPEEYGGGGGDLFHLLILMEELSAVSAGLAGVLGTTVLFGGLNLLHSGTEEQRRAYIPGMCRGEVRCAMAITEPDAGSDVAGITTRAEPDGDTWLLNGRKVFITGAYEATMVLVVARSGKGAVGRHGLSVFLVPRDAAGFEVRKLDKLGTRGISACELTFDDVVLPLDAVLGGPESTGRGWTQVMATFDLERIIMSVQALGIARAAFEKAAGYARQRRQFGRPISRFQAIGHMIADMATDVEASRAFLYSVAERFISGLPCTKEAAMLKVFVTERSKEVCLRGMQILGGYGYMMEYDMQRHLRDSLLGPIGAGTSQIQRNIIGRELGL